MLGKMYFLPAQNGYEAAGDGTPCAMAVVGDKGLVEISLTGDQMLTVLEVVASDGPLSAAEVARACDINRTVAHRLLTTLAQRSYVRRGEEGYMIGPAVLRLAPAADADLRRAAKPVMNRLARETGETVVLHGLDNLEAVVIEQSPGQQHLVRVEHSPGSRHKLSQGASGWSLLAFQSEKTIARALKKAGSEADARKRIDAVKAEGYAISHDELQQGVHGIAVPLVETSGRCQASLAILAPSVRAGSLPNRLKTLKAAADEIVAALR